MSMTPVSSGIAADGAQRRWCPLCEQYTWQAFRSSTIVSKTHRFRDPQYHYRNVWKCERCNVNVVDLSRYSAFL